MRVFLLATIGVTAVLIVVAGCIYLYARLNDHKWREHFHEDELFADIRKLLTGIPHWRTKASDFRESAKAKGRTPAVRSGKQPYESGLTLLQELLRHELGEAKERGGEGRMGEPEKSKGPKSKANFTLNAADSQALERDNKVVEKYFQVGFVAAIVMNMGFFVVCMLVMKPKLRKSLGWKYVIVSAMVSALCFGLMVVLADSIANTNDVYRDVEVLLRTPEDPLTGELLLTSCYLTSSFNSYVKKMGWDKIRRELHVCEDAYVKMAVAVVLGIATIVYFFLIFAFAKYNQQFKDDVLNIAESVGLSIQASAIMHENQRAASETKATKGVKPNSNEKKTPSRS